ncbi:glycerol-3-phosphate 1-O-acyltransferase PlsY [Ideonella livida]|uniref:Glycerol-3-phosphate acyltransferase n=1 Tax=Ideonella livida TaxID=2707176 RepID=A0A7C9PG67_9BURK|nr:glycerol-3-phosphate 1-O-acyltransferase PlsY [Ideonella livida]NDY90652.1 glycerol-3-phosphate 1-O-acyltransferase PlsY [Ideonella livida]
MSLSPTVLSPVLILAAYLFGSLSFAVLVSRWMGLDDPRTYGSGNPGATNVLRSGSKKAAILTLLLDALKGFVPVLLVRVFAPELGVGVLTVGLVGLAAFLGHLWPVFFRFQGGKGVATAAGVMLAWSPWLGLAVLLTWLAVAYLSRYSSLAAICACLAAPVYQMLFWDDVTLLLAMVPMCLLLVWRHEGNIRKLLAGTESRIGQKAASPAPAPHAPLHPHAHGGKHAAGHGRGRRGSKSSHSKGKH